VRHRSSLAALSVLVVAAGTVVALTACGSADTPPAAPGAVSPASSSGPLSGTVTVFAAASLQGSFTTLASRFAQAHPGVTVRPSFAASSALAQQIDQGAPADVFASASQSTMDLVVQAGGAASSTTFATNVMAIAVPPGNPAGIAGVADLAKEGVKVALCQAQVPCGSVAAKVFANAKVAVTAVTQEADVKAVLTKVQLGEVDAGVVYVTDVESAGDKVQGIEIAGDVNASTSYPIAALATAPNPDAAAAFVAYVLSPDGQAVLRAGGFTAP
jgi:molybdate transport system substrate-binding protein